MGRKRLTGVEKFPLILLLVMAVGCSSVEDRIERVIAHELEQCQESDDEFYTVTTYDDSSYEVLAELCELEPSAVEMTNEWRGFVRTGPAMWTAEEDQELSAVVITRVAWDELNRAQSAAGSQSEDIDALERAEEHFSNAQDEYDESAWLRLQRLDNLLALQAERRSMDEDGDLLGDELREYIDDTMQWAEQRDDRDTQGRVRLAVIDHLDDHIERQNRAIDRLGVRDDHLRSAAEAAEEQGEPEEAEKYREELEKQLEERPERRELFESLRANAREQACVFVDDLSVDGIETEELRSRVSSTLTDFDCDIRAETTDDNEDDE